MYALDATKTVTLRWMDPGQIPNEHSFQAGATPGNLSRHATVDDAVSEAMRQLVDGSAGNRNPWILCGRMVLEPAEIQMLDRHTADKMIDGHIAKSPDAIRRYYAEWG